MSNGQSRFLEVLGVKERALKKQLAPKRKMLEMSRASTVARAKEAGLIPTNRNDIAAALAGKKPAAKHGGRKRLSTDKRRFYMIGCLVEQMFPRFESAFKISKELKITNGSWDLNSLRSELAKHRYVPKEIDAVLTARTPMGAAKRFVARSLTSRAYPSGISLQTVSSCYSRYLQALKSKRSLL